MAKQAVFLEGDGILNVEADAISNIEEIQLLPKVAQAVRKLNDLGIFCCLVSHHSGPARNLYPLSRVEAFHQRLSQLLNQQGKAKLDAFYYCPYLSPAAGGVNTQLSAWSSWRKPNPGMLVAAAWQHDLDLQLSFMVGHRQKDVDMAHNAGLKGILITPTNHGTKVVKPNDQHRTKADYVAKDLSEAVTWITKQLKKIYPDNRRLGS